MTVLEIDSPDSRLAEIQRMAAFIVAALADCRGFRFVSVNRDGHIERLAERKPAL